MPTQFLDLTSNTELIGVRIFDNVRHAYDNTWTEFPATEEEYIVKLLDSVDDQINDLIFSAFDEGEDVIVGSKLFPSSAFRQIVEKNA